MSLDWRAGKATQHWLRERDEEKMIKTFENLVSQFGLEPLKEYVDVGNAKGHGILHTLITGNKINVVEYLVREHGFDLNVQRSDGCTILHLACYNHQDALVDRLLALGADETIQNSYGELAQTWRDREQNFKQRISAACSVDELLEVLRQTELAGQGKLDVVTAYFNLVTKAADYDAVHCTYKTERASATRIMRDPRSWQLEQALCSLVQSSETAEDVELWPSLLAGMVKVQSLALEQAFGAKFRQQQALRRLLGLCEASLLVRLAWHLAKLKSLSSAVRDSTMQVLADLLYMRISDLPLRSVSQLLWSYGETCSRHAALLDAVSVFIVEHIDELEAQSLSNMAWAMVKLAHSQLTAPCARALQAIRGRAVQQMQYFGDQNVANLLWAMSKLQIQDAAAYNACFRRASITLYDAQACRNHVKQSSQEFVMHWAQNYIAYEFVCSTPEPHKSLALEGLRQQYLQDLREVPRRVLRGGDHHSFSNGTQAQIADLQAQELMQAVIVNHEESLEVHNVAAQAAEQALLANESLSKALLRRRLGCWLLEVSRAPQEYREALLRHPALQTCKQELEEQGYKVELPSGAKVFLHRWDYEGAVRYFEQQHELKRWHIIVSSEFEDAVREVISGLPSSSSVRVKSMPKPKRRVAENDAAAADRTQVQWGHVQVARTFIHLPTQGALLSSASALPVGAVSAP